MDATRHRVVRLSLIAFIPVSLTLTACLPLGGSSSAQSAQSARPSATASPTAVPVDGAQDLAPEVAATSTTGESLAVPATPAGPEAAAGQAAQAPQAGQASAAGTQEPAGSQGAGAGTQDAAGTGATAGQAADAAQAGQASAAGTQETQATEGTQEPAGSQGASAGTQDAEGRGARNAPAVPDASVPDSEVLVVEPGADLSAAVKEAASTGRGVRLTAGASYTLTEPVVLPDTVPFLDGNGATVDVAIPGTTRSAPASALAVATGSTDTVITNLTLDLADSRYTRGIAIVSASRVTVSGVTMTGSTFRAIEVAATTGPVSDLLITGNTVTSPAGTAETKGEIVSVMLSTAFAQPDDQFASSASPIWDRYTTDGTVSPTKYEHRNISVVGNTITGGYYGLSLSGVTDSVVSNNTITDNMRNISMQNHADNNLVEDNNLSQSRSSSVHVAYGSDSNMVRGNTITSTQAVGQGLLQAYMDSDDNTFTGNSVTVSGSQPGWILYVGTDSDRVTFSGNTVTGNARKAMIGVESVWDYDSSRSGLSGANPAAYMSSKVAAATDGSLITYNGGWGPLTGTTITDNVLQPGDPKAPVIYVGAEVSAGRDGTKRIVGDVTDVTLRGNTVVGQDYSEGLRTHEGSLPGVGAATITFADDSVGTYATASPTATSTP